MNWQEFNKSFIRRYYSRRGTSISTETTRNIRRKMIKDLCSFTHQLLDVLEKYYDQFDRLTEMAAELLRLIKNDEMEIVCKNESAILLEEIDREMGCFSRFQTMLDNLHKNFTQSMSYMHRKLENVKWELSKKYKSPHYELKTLRHIDQMSVTTIPAMIASAGGKIWLTCGCVAEIFTWLTNRKNHFMQMFVPLADTSATNCAEKKVPACEASYMPLTTRQCLETLRTLSAELKYLEKTEHAAMLLLEDGKMVVNNMSKLLPLYVL